MGYVDGMSLYEYEKGRPISGTDSLGLKLSDADLALWQFALFTAIANKWEVSTEVLSHYIAQARRDDLPEQPFGKSGTFNGATLDLSGTPAAWTVWRDLRSRIQDDMYDHISASAMGSQVFKNERLVKVSHTFPARWEENQNPDLFFSLHGAQVRWEAEVKIDCSNWPWTKTSFLGMIRQVPFRVTKARWEVYDTFDFNPGQFKRAPFKQLNDGGVRAGVWFPIQIIWDIPVDELNGEMPVLNLF